MVKQIFLTLCLLLVGLLIPATARAETAVFIDSLPLQSSIAPLENSDPNNPPLLPLRAVYQAMGCLVHWDAATSSISIKNSQTHFQIQPGTGTVRLNNQEVLVPEIKMIDGNLMAPLDLWKLTQSDYYNISWDALKQQVSITRKTATQGSISWIDGAYTGSLVNGVPEGQGTITWPDGYSFQGNFHEGFPTPKGYWFDRDKKPVKEKEFTLDVYHKGPNPTNQVFAWDGAYLYFCDPSAASSGQIYKNDLKAQTARVNPEIASHIDAVNGWVYYRNESEGGKLYRISNQGLKRQRISDLLAMEILATKSWVFFTSQEASGDYVLYRLDPDSKAIKSILKTKYRLSDVQVNGDNLVFAGPDCLFRSGLNGEHIMQLADFGEAISNVRTQGNWIYYLQNGVIKRISQNGQQVEKVLDLSQKPAQDRDIWIGEQYIYIGSWGDQVGGNSLEQYPITGSGSTRLLEGNYRLLGLDNSRLYFIQTGKSPILGSLTFVAGQSPTMREYKGTTSPEDLYGGTSSVLSIDEARLVDNLKLAADAPEIQKTFDQLGASSAKTTITISKSEKLLIVDPDYLNFEDQDDVYSKVLDQGVFLTAFGGKINGPVLKIANGSLKILNVWDKRDASGEAIFPSQLQEQIEEQSYSLNILNGNHKSLLFLDYNSSMQNYLSEQLEKCPHLIVSMRHGIYQVAYEQWDPTLQNPSNELRRNPVVILKEKLSD